MSQTENAQTDSRDLVVPDIGDHDSLELMNWLLKDGEAFSAGDEICELVTDKAVFPLEAEKDGRLEKILVESPCAVNIGQVIGRYSYND